MSSYIKIDNAVADSGQISNDLSVWGDGHDAANLAQDMQKCQDACDRMADCGGYVRSVAWSKNHCNFFKTNATFKDVSSDHGYTLYLRKSRNPSNSTPSSSTPSSSTSSSSTPSSSTSSSSTPSSNNDNGSIQKEINDKIAEIYQVPGTESANYKENYDHTMNMGILWAAIGTVVLFYTFRSI